MVLKIETAGFRSLMYRSGWLYNAVTRRLYDQDKKFSTIATFIGKGPKRVLDLPCGTGYLMRFLHPAIEYEGADLNHRFLKRIRKKELKKRNIKLTKIILRHKNIFDFQDYQGKKKDVIVLCDILHHIYPKHIDLINIAKKIANKIVVCEPYVINPKEISARDKLFKIVIFFGKHLPKPLLKIIDFLLLDNDGINSFQMRSQWNLDEKSLKEFYKVMGFNKVYKILDEYIAIWES
ncbi:MAG: class I SAM-dependent methyltransferase [Candidatus Lokiarchaeota archaeon]|nr:class I SAM-dependent methyltransferase [Candidatus Lokiarchaeota archaeon]MCK4480525.1 class I SAM-dependent methyltransferase [Candidatus Lokiarchaeota archaeon]